MIGSNVLLLVLSYMHIAQSEYVTTDNFGEKKFGDLIVRNDNWGPGAPPQTLHAQSGSCWWVESCAGSSGGIKSYPHTAKPVNQSLCNLTKVDTTFKGYVNITGQGTTAYSFSYDIWCENKKYEIMLWMHKEGAIAPIGSMKLEKQFVGGYTWDVWYGNNGHNLVFSFVNTQSCFEGHVNVKQILVWIVGQKWISEGTNVVLDEVQLGYEITSTPPNSKLYLTGFTCTVK